MYCQRQSNLKDTRPQGRPPSEETLRRRKIKASIPEYIKKRLGRKDRIIEFKKFYRLIVAWETTQKRRGLTDDYIELVAMEENGVYIDLSLEPRYQTALEIFEKKNVILKKQRSLAGKKSASSRQINAESRRKIVGNLFLEISKEDTKDRFDTTMASLLLKRWPKCEIEPPSHATLRRMVAILNLSVNNKKK